MKVCCLAVSSALHFGCSVLQCKRNAPPPSHLLTQKCEGCPYWFTPCGWLPGGKAKGTCQTEHRAPPLFCRAAAKRPQSLPCAAAEVSGGAAVWGSRPSCHSPLRPTHPGVCRQQRGAATRLLGAGPAASHSLLPRGTQPAHPPMHTHTQLHSLESCFCSCRTSAAVCCCCCVCCRPCLGNCCGKDRGQKSQHECRLGNTDSNAPIPAEPTIGCCSTHLPGTAPRPEPSRKRDWRAAGRAGEDGERGRAAQQQVLSMLQQSEDTWNTLRTPRTCFLHALTFHTSPVPLQVSQCVLSVSAFYKSPSFPPLQSPVLSCTTLSEALLSVLLKATDNQNCSSKLTSFCHL